MPTDPGSVVEEEDADERTKGGKAGKGGASVVKEPQARKKQKQEGAPGADGQVRQRSRAVQAHRGPLL